MRFIWGASLFIVAACSGADDERANGIVPEAPARPSALSNFEKNAKARFEQARSERNAAALEARVRTAMETYLNDPFSARYRQIRSGRGGAVCGQLNAKNALGAYVGFKDFVVGRDGRTVYFSAYADGVRSELYSSFADAYVNVCASRSEANAYRAATSYYDPYDMSSNTTM